jgi:hypothetical protein
VNRYLVAVVVIVATQLSIWRLQQQSVIDAARAADFEVESLPSAFGAWSGSTMPTDAEIFREVGALKMTERMYVNEQGVRIGVIVATFPTGTDVLPHPPDLCYTGEGWNVRSDVWKEDTRHRRYKLMLVERNRHEALVSYWYQLGADVASNRNELRQILQKLRKAHQPWPPLVKVLIHVPVEFSEADAKTASEELGHAIYHWVADHTGEPDANHQAAAE